MSEKLRIAIVISHPIQHFCPQYVSFAANSDVSIKVFFGSTLGYKNYRDENFKREISWGNLNLDKFDHVFLNGDKLLQPGKNLDAPTLERELDDYNPALLFTYGYFQKLQRRAYGWAVKKGVSIAYMSDSELRHHSNPIKEFFKSFFLKRYFSKIDYFLSVGNANEAYYEKHGVKQDQIIRMHYPIDFEAYKKSYEKKEVLRNAIRNNYNIRGNDVVLCVVGKLVRWKNQDHIIDALQLLENEGIYSHLFIVGSGERKADWQLKAADLKHSKVHFAGFVDIGELPSYFAATDIYVHPASLEPHSVAISEAIQMGCPVILSDRCGSYGFSDDVQGGRNGFIYTFGNVRELADKIKGLIQDKEKRKTFGSYSHSIALSFQNNSHFAMMEKLVQRVNGLYEK